MKVIKNAAVINDGNEAVIQWDENYWTIDRRDYEPVESRKNFLRLFPNGPFSGEVRLAETEAELQMMGPLQIVDADELLKREQEEKGAA